MSGIPSLTILSEEQKFNGENLLQWTTNMNLLLGSKGLLGYIDGTIQKPTQPSVSTTTDTDNAATTAATPIYSTTPTLDEWNFHDQLTRGHVALNCTDIASLGVNTTGTAKEAWESIQTEWGKSTDMRRSHAQEALNRTIYVEGTDIQEHIKLLRTRKAALNNLSTSAMDDEAWRGIIIRSLPTSNKWLPVIPALYGMTNSASIISTLIAHAMILGRDVTKHATTSNSTNTALAARANESCTNPNCKAKKRSTHTVANCYWPGGGKEGQFPPNFGQRARANAAVPTPGTTPAVSNPQTSANVATVSTAPNQIQNFVLSAHVIDNPGKSGVIIDEVPAALISRGFQKFGMRKVPTFMDSGASDTMFVSREVFIKYTPTASRKGDSAKAVICVQGN
jgi:hypothetical protein